MEALKLFHKIKKTKSNKEIAKSLFIHKGTVDRWERLNEVPDFYRNDLLRMLGLKHKFVIGVEESDQFYTSPETAKECISHLRLKMKRYKIDTSKYIFVEPGAGCGNFYSLLPEKRRIGIEIQPQKSPLTHRLPKGIIKADFLKWTTPNNNKYIAVGNPPFGRNGKTALDFVIKSFEFADIVAFILPPIFDSTGKGSCKNRLNKLGYILLATKYLKNSSFMFPNGKIVKVKTIFQIWSKIKPKGYKRPILKTCNSFVDIFNICIPYKPSRFPSHIDKIGQCDVYLPRTFWKKEMAKPTQDFYTIPYNDGYGIKIKKNKREIKKIIFNNNWPDLVHTSTDNSKSLRKDIICYEIIKRGFYDR